MRTICQNMVTAIIPLLYTLVFIPFLSAQEAAGSSGPSVGEFLTPDNRFDLDAARNAGFQGPLDMEGFESETDDEGRPVFRSTVASGTAGSSDDVYWDSRITLTIFNITGQKVATLIHETMPAGRHSVVWNAAGMPSGMYFCTVKAGDFAETRKMVLLK